MQDYEWLQNMLNIAAFAQIYICCESEKYFIFVLDWVNHGAVPRL